MSLGFVLDAAVCALVVLVALWTVSARDPFGNVIGFIIYGLLVAIGWVRLGAADVALAEAAIGAGLTGLLLLAALGKLDQDRPGSAPRARAAPAVLCALVGLALGWAVVDLAGVSAGLQPLVTANLTRSGVENPVTAVLLNFRGYDTLLESVVLTVALVGVWSLSEDHAWGGRPGAAHFVQPEGILAVFGRVLPPIGVVVGIYVAWVGSSAPGGAFQAGTILAAVWLLAILTGGAEAPPVGSTLVRIAVVAGPVVFLGVGLAGVAAGAFLAYPPGLAKTLILVVEAALTLSIAATLALLVAGPATRKQ